jgi:hypothetical protein
MKSIDVDTVKPFVNAAIYALNIVTQAKEQNNQRAVEIELENAKRELRALLERLVGTEP